MKDNPTYNKYIIQFDSYFGQMSMKVFLYFRAAFSETVRKKNNLSNHVRDKLNYLVFGSLAHCYLVPTNLGRKMYISVK